MKHQYKPGHRTNVGRKHNSRMRYKCSLAKRGQPSHWAGSRWYHRKDTYEQKRFHPSDVPYGWFLGRGLEWADDARTYIRRRWPSSTY